MYILACSVPRQFSWRLVNWGVRVEAVEGRLAIDEIVVCRPEFRLERADESLHLFCSYAGPSAFPCRSC